MMAPLYLPSSITIYVQCTANQQKLPSVQEVQILKASSSGTCARVFLKRKNESSYQRLLESLDIIRSSSRKSYFYGNPRGKYHV
ncbi:hypothetical protein QOT17_017056 [Balamuthia mandrillaris]